MSVCMQTGATVITTSICVETGDTLCQCVFRKGIHFVNVCGDTGCALLLLVEWRQETHWVNVHVDRKFTMSV